MRSRASHSSQKGIRLGYILPFSPMKANHIKSAQDLVTVHSQVSKGFLEQALYKSDSAHPFITRAKAFRQELTKVRDASDIIKNKVLNNDFKNELLAASGFSDKATSHLSQQELTLALDKVLTKIYNSSKLEKISFQDELVYRYLLTKGDTLGGSSRNNTGALAGKKLTSSIIVALNNIKISPTINTSPTGKIQAMYWDNRFLAFDIKPKIIGKNIDAILLNTTGIKSIDKSILEQPNRYLACGELKGGIDPAGADEHWKTANSALDRINQKFSDKSKQPSLFFVGAAIESSMAQEIFEQLQSKKLAYAANLSVKEQLDKLASWLVGL